MLLLAGPPAVGKMSVGRQIAAMSTFRLFHNHHTIEPLLEVFGYGTPPFRTLDREFRRRVIEEAAGVKLELIFTAVWDFADAADLAYAEHIIAPYREAGAPVRVAELLAPLPVRLARNRGADRLAAKPSKQDLQWSEQNVRQMDRHVLDSTRAGVAPAWTGMLDHLGHRRFDTTEQTLTQTAADVLAWVDAETLSGRSPGAARPAPAAGQPARHSG